MNREILFRGIRVDNGEWVYGDLVHDAISAYSTMMKVGIRQGGCYPDEVKPETVGQYTGLTDRNGVKIFEGDKLKSPNAIVNIVVFENSTWGVKYRLGKMGGLNPFSNMNLLYWEVCGNIHTP